MNKVILIGRLTRDAELRMAKEIAVARGSMAVDRPYSKDGQATADFINLVAFGKTAEFLEKYGKKGTKFAIEGSIQTGSYKKDDGTTVYTTDVKVDRVEFCESKKAEQPATQEDEGFVNVPEGIDGELPFV